VAVTDVMNTNINTRDVYGGCQSFLVGSKLHLSHYHSKICQYWYIQRNVRSARKCSSVHDKAVSTVNTRCHNETFVPIQERKISALCWV